MAVGRRAAGLIVAGRLAAGLIAAGRRVAGLIAAGRLAAGLIAAGRRVVARLAAGRLAADRLPDDLPADLLPPDDLPRPPCRPTTSASTTSRPGVHLSDPHENAEEHGDQPQQVQAFHNASSPLELALAPDRRSAELLSGPRHDPVRAGRSSSSLCCGDGWQEREALRHPTVRNSPRNASRAI